jgi:hypothetical protein
MSKEAKEFMWYWIMHIVPVLVILGIAYLIGQL